MKISLAWFSKIKSFSPFQHHVEIVYIVLNIGNLLISGNAQNVLRVTGNEETDVLTTGNE